MLPLLYSLVFVEMAVSLTLLFKTPLRSLLVMCLDAVKRGKGLIMAESVAGTLFVVLISSVYSIITIKKRSIDAGAVTPTDQVLLANHILEVTLMGFTLFLGLIIDRQHSHVKELRYVGKNLEVAKRMNEGYTANDQKAKD